MEISDFLLYYHNIGSEARRRKSSIKRMTKTRNIIKNFYLQISKILRTFALETIRDMEKIAYANKNGKTIYENVERFNIRGTIMSVTTNKVADSFTHRLYVEDSRGGHTITIWSTAKGYDRELIKQGHSARFKGVAHRQHYIGADGTDKVFLNYRASEISKE